ncbi:MAG: hypothetical protein QMC67_12755 [Candidatus Wallbacteria bacterium]
MTPEFIGINIAAILTLGIFSFLYKDNFLYKIAEYMFIGTSAGYLLSVTYNNIIKTNVYQPLVSATPDYSVLIPTFMGLLMLTMLVPSLSVLSRIPISYVVGFGAGAGAMASIQTDIIPQIYATMLPITGINLVSLNNFLIILGVVCSLIYFFFSTEHKGLVFGTGSQIGIIYLMITFGAQFGTTIMGRIQLLINRCEFLLRDWLHFIN